MLRKYMLDSFELDYYKVVYHQIGKILAYFISSKPDLDARLGFNEETSIFQCQKKRVLVNSFEKAKTKFIVNLEKNFEDSLCEEFMFHGRFISNKIVSHPWHPCLIRGIRVPSCPIGRILIFSIFPPSIPPSLFPGNLFL